MKKVLVVINPNAGNGDHRDFERQARSYCKSEGVDLTVYYTQGDGEEKRLKELLGQHSFQIVFSAGGDGTFTQLADILSNQPIQMAILPMGTSNGLASDLGINPNPIKAFKDTLNSTKSLALDQVRVNAEKSLYHIGDIGANANLVKKYEESGEETYAAYAKHALGEVLEEKRFQYKIKTADGGIVEGSAQMIAICNARRFGTKIALNQTSHPADGKFELIIFEHIDFGTLLGSVLNSVWHGFSRFSSDTKKIIQTTSAEIEISPKTSYQIDGELMGETEHLKIELNKAAIELLCQENCPYLNE